MPLGPSKPFLLHPCYYSTRGKSWKIEFGPFAGNQSTKEKAQKKNELLKGGGWHDHSSSYSVTLKLNIISLYMSLNASLI